MATPSATAVTSRPARKTHGGSGVPRTRFKMPLSRCWVSVIDRLTKVALTTARATIPGT